MYACICVCVCVVAYVKHNAAVCRQCFGMYKILAYAVTSIKISAGVCGGRVQDNVPTFQTGIGVRRYE